MADYSYQKKLIADTITNLDIHKIALMACATASGKTNMAVEVIADYLKKNPTKRVLFLAHGTTTLRQQVARDFKKIRRFTSSEIMGDADTTTQVHVAIPQNKLIRTQEYGLIVVDEAHQYYDAKMVQSIVASNPDCSRLLLTASSGKFTFRKTPAVYFSLLEALDAGTIMEPSIGIITTDQDFRHFDAEGNLSSREKLKEVASLVRKFKAKAKGKTLVACHNQTAAVAVGHELGKRVAVVSTHEEDPNSIDFNNFIKDPKIKYLVVVFKGVVGFSMNELETVVDLTASQNVDRITQLLGRIIRVKKGKKPIYIKLAPKIQTEWYQHVMSAVMTLAHPDVYRQWNGRIDSIKIPVTRVAASKGEVKKGVRSIPKFKPKIPKWVQLRNLYKDANNFVNLKKVKNIFAGFDRDPEGKREELRLLAISGSSKPEHGSSLYSAFKQYTDPRHASFDQDFYAYMKKIRPEWMTVTLKEGKHYKIASLKEFYETYGRLPKNVSGEKALYARLAELVGIESKRYDPDMRIWAIDRGWDANRTANGRSVVCNETKEIFTSIHKAAAAISTGPSYICQVLKGKRPSIKGYTFTYVDE